MFVYAMLSETGEVKIGKSICPEKRAPDIANEFNTNIIDMLYVRCGSLTAKVERICHIIHQKKMISLEWFSIAFEHAVKTILAVKDFCIKEPNLKYHTVSRYKEDIMGNMPFETRFPFEKNRGKAEK